MTSSEVSLILIYLNDAAHLLHSSAPDISAHLMTQRGSLMFHHGISPSEVQRQHICGSCGHIMLTGGDDALKLKSSKHSRRLGKKPPHTTISKTPATPKEMTKTIACSRCHRLTKIKIQGPKPVKRLKAKAKQPMEKEAEEPAKPTANASSKKRAKNRKAGLQALLSGQKSQKSSPLSLASFMKK